MTKVKFEYVFGAMAALLGLGFILSKSPMAAASTKKPTEDELPPVDGEVTEPQGLSSLPISQSLGVYHKYPNDIGKGLSVRVDIRWMVGLWDYRNVYMAIYEIGETFPGYTRVSQNGSIAINRTKIYLGGNVATGISVLPKVKGNFRIIIRAYLGSGIWQSKVYDIRST